MNRFLGKIEPIGKRWVWPLAEMEEGDWFLVDWELRDPEKVRHLVGVRAAQLGVRFSVEKRSAEHQGYCKVTRVGEHEAPSVREQIDYETMGTIYSRYYGIDHNGPWTILRIGEVDWVSAKQIEEPRQKQWIMTIPDLWTFFVELFPNGIRVERVQQGSTLASIRAKKLEEVMS